VNTKNKTLTLALVTLIAGIYFIGATAQPGSRTYNLFNRGRLYSSGKLLTDTYLEVGSTGAATNSFTTSATADTVVVSGLTATSVVVVNITDASPVANDLLSVTVTTDTFFVHRPAGTTSGLTYSWFRVD